VVREVVYYAVITNDQVSRSRPSVPIAVGPIVEMAVDRAKLPPILNFFFGFVLNGAIRKAFRDAEREAQTRTIRLSSNHN